MSDSTTVSPGYALGQLERALASATSHVDPEVRRRAEAKAERWQAVLEGMHDGTLRVGSRTPVADTPAWVTLEVAHGGFATGAYLAEGELLEHEEELLATLPDTIPGSTPRERLNGWYLGDAGQRELSAALAERRYHVEVPEEAALPTVVALLERGRAVEALELLEILRPLMHRLRFYPRLSARPRPSGACVRLTTVAEVSEQLRATRLPPQIAAMHEALQVWNPLFDRLVELWLDTVEGEPPDLQRDELGELVARAGDGQPIVIGGWPCKRWPSDWVTRRKRWLADYRAAAEAHGLCNKHRHPRSNFSHLREALERCAVDSRRLTGRDVGRIRRALANTNAKQGVPGTDRRVQLRRIQAALAAMPSFAALARLLAKRVESFPREGGLPSLEGFDIPARADEAGDVPAGTALPLHLLAKLERALEAPVQELIDRGVIGSSEVLALVLPQITAQIAAAGIDDPILRELFEQTYAAFRRRRSLLLLDLEHQVQLDELPWIGALQPFRASSLDGRVQARATLEQVALLSLSAWPETILPNRLIRELATLAEQAGMKLPFVEEVAADIFMGTFTRKWIDAAKLACATLQGTLYARYYDLPAADDPRLAETKRRFRKQTAEGFAELCRARAKEAERGSSRSFVAGNGAIIEQSQILTTHNLALLTHELGLRETLRALAPELVEQVLGWIIQRQTQKLDSHHAELILVKNLAYAWRQAIFLLSLCGEDQQRELVRSFATALAEQRGEWVERFMPALVGLELVIEGGRFDAHGRGRDRDNRKAIRLLGWSVGPHWLLDRSLV